MPASDYPHLLSALAATPRRLQNFTAAVTTLEEGISRGAIANARFQDAKGLISNALEKGWRHHLQDPFLWNRDYPASEEERAVFYAFSGHPMPHTLNGFRKTCARLPEGAVRSAIDTFLAEITPLCEALQCGKGMTVKREPAAPATDVLDRYRAPDAPASAMKQVHDLLVAITREARNGLVDRLLERGERMLSAYLRAQAEPRQPAKALSPLDWLASVAEKADAGDYRMLSDCVEARHDAGSRIVRHVAKPAVADVLRKHCERMADEICAQFIRKNVEKLDSILAARGDFLALEELGRKISPDAMQGRLRISFEDGASFEARTAAVLSFSVHGKPFLRFPLTFHDVILGDGTALPRPSEKSMNEEFVRARQRPDTPEPG